MPDGEGYMADVVRVGVKVKKRMETGYHVHCTSEKASMSPVRI